MITMRRREWQAAWAAAQDRTETCGQTVTGDEADWNLSVVCPDGAQPTSRRLADPYSDYSEYRQYMIINGFACAAYWMFSQAEMDDCDGDEGNLDWSFDNLDRVESAGN